MVCPRKHGSPVSSIRDTSETIASLCGLRDKLSKLFLIAGLIEIDLIDKQWKTLALVGDVAVVG